MWILAIISILICALLWFSQIKHNLKIKRKKRKEKVIRKLEKYAEQSKYGDIFEDIIDMYEASDSIEIEALIQNSALPRYEKVAIIYSLNRILKTGIDEKTGLHKKTLVLGRIIGYLISIVATAILCFIKRENISLIEILIFFASSNVIVTFSSYIVIEVILSKDISLRKKNNREPKNAKDKEKISLFDRVFDVLDTIFGRY